MRRERVPYLALIIFLCTGVAATGANPSIQIAGPIPSTAVPISAMVDLDALRIPDSDHRILALDPLTYQKWRSEWARGILQERPGRYCDTAMGEEIGWLISPNLAGYYYGFLATSDSRWTDLLIQCADGWIARAVKEPDGYLGWPKFGAAGADIDRLNDFFADSMLGEAMALRPLMMLSATILRTPELAQKYNAKANEYIELSEQIFEKWNSRGGWRDIRPNETISIYLPFGIDQTHNTWTPEYRERFDATVGFSHQDNKANLVASWLLAMFDSTQKQLYRDRAEHWFRIMKSRMKPKDDGTFQIWNYWEPSGRWDYKPNGSTKHWIGIHPNGGYYDIDVEAVVNAYTHGVIFTEDDIKRLIATALAEKRHWTALVPYDQIIQRHFEETLIPAGWAGHSKAAWYLALEQRSQPVPRP